MQKLSKRNHKAIFLAVLLLTLFMVYFNSFSADWHYDDYHHILDNPHIRKLSNIPQYFVDSSAFSRNPGSKMYRPLLMATHAVNFQMSLRTSGDGYNRVVYHVTNFLIHAVTTIAVFFILLFIFRNRSPLDHKISFYAAFFSSFLFGLNTINSEAVVYISSRSSILASMFFFLAFYVYMKATSGEQTRWFPLFLSILFFICALFSKEIAITFPGIVLFYEFLLNRQSQWNPAASRNLKISVLRVLPFFLTGGMYLLLRQSVTNVQLTSHLVAKGGPYASPDLFSQFATQSRVLIIYIREWFLPISLSIDKAFTVSRGFLELRVILSLLLIVALVTVALLIRRRNPILTFGILWFFVCLLPTSTFRLNVPLNDHRLYLPGLGLAIVTGYLWARLATRYFGEKRRSSSVLVVVTVLILLFMGAGTIKRNTTYRSIESLWADTLRKNPSSLRALHGLSRYYQEHYQLEKARFYLSKALELEPGDAILLMNLATIEYDLGRTEAAARLLEEVIKVAPNLTRAHYNLGKTMRKLGRLPEAERSFQTALIQNPLHSEAAYELGTLYLAQNRLDMSEKYFLRVLEIDPAGMSFAYYILGTIHEQQGRKMEALKAYKRYLNSGRGDAMTMSIARQRLEILRGGNPEP